MSDDPIEEALRDAPLEIGNTIFRTPLSDVWNAETLEILYGNNLHYCASLGGWFLWSEQRWVTDTTDAIFEWARVALRQRGLEALDNENEPIMRHIMKSFSHGRLVAMLAQAATFPAGTLTTLVTSAVMRAWAFVSPAKIGIDSWGFSPRS